MIKWQSPSLSYEGNQIVRIEQHKNDEGKPQTTADQLRRMRRHLIQHSVMICESCAGRWDEAGIQGGDGQL
ncbi:MAG: hypothetical protein ACLVJ6_11085 [Merdibacter sp.]